MTILKNLNRSKKRRKLKYLQQLLREKIFTDHLLRNLQGLKKMKIIMKKKVEIMQVKIQIKIYPQSYLLKEREMRFMNQQDLK